MTNLSSLRFPGLDKPVRIARRSFLASAGAAGGLAAISGAFAGALEQTTSPDPAAGLSELTCCSATKLAEMIRTKQVSSEEVVRAHIERIKSVNPTINAVIYLAEDQAIKQAREADRTIAQGVLDWRRLPLLGLPVTIKDCFNVGGMPTTLGVPSLKNQIAESNATAVRRLVEAGAIVIGKTNMPVLASFFETSNPLHGRTNNPYDSVRTAGGSSGGEAAIIAACGSPLGLGSDAGGSIRVPSHFCGIAGIRPAWGRVPLCGHMPFSPDVSPDIGPLFNTAGPMARSVEDLALALEVLAGPDPHDPFSFPVPLRDWTQVELKKLRVAHWTGIEPTTPSDETLATIEKAVAELVHRGVVGRKEQPEHLAKVWDVVLSVAPDYFSDFLPQTLRDYGLPDLEPLTIQNLELLRIHRARTPKETLQRARREWLSMVRTSVLTFLQKYDVIISPVCSYPAMKHETTMASLENLNGFVWTWAFSLVPGVPAGVVRCGTSSDGMPIGVQVAAKPFREDLVLAVMRFLQDRFGGWQSPRL